MHDIALFVDSDDGGWSKLSTFGAVDLTDKVAVSKAIAAARKDAGNWSSHYSKYFYASFAVFSSKHGYENWKMLQHL